LDLFGGCYERKGKLNKIGNLTDPAAQHCSAEHQKESQEAAGNPELVIFDGFNAEERRKNQPVPHPGTDGVGEPRTQHWGSNQKDSMMEIINQCLNQ
jgi:hypothetical protein